MAHSKVIIIDDGAQVTHLIARRVREAGVYSEIHACTVTAAEVAAMAPSAIILSGGPASVGEADAPTLDKGFLELGVSPEQAPDTPTYVTIHFEKGIPTAIDGKEMGAVEIVETLNKIGGANGIGLLDIVENRLVGMKSRGV